MKVTLVLLLILSLSSCKKDELGPQFIDQGGLGSGNKLAVLNEGNFGWSNSSLTIYYDGLSQVSNNVFLNNNSFSMGDVGNDMTLIGDELFLVINNSGTIYSVDTGTFELTATIAGFNSPRSLLDLNNGLAMVSELYNDQLEILDLNTKTVIDTIQIGEWTEKMILYNGHAFVALPESGRIFKVDINSFNIVDSIQLTKGVNSLVLDQNNKLWVMCDGGFNEFQPLIYRVNPFTMTVETSIPIGSVNSSPSNLVANADADELYYLNDGLFKISILATLEPSSNIYKKQGASYYKLYFDNSTNSLFLSNVKDYIQNSEIVNIDVNGNENYAFEAGIISGSILRIE